MTVRLDHSLLAARTLTPKRGDPWPARKLARGITEPADAWKALASFLGPLGRGEALRSFERAPAVLGGAAPLTPGLDVLPHPPTLSGCLAFATDPEGVAAAEDLARETCRRLAPFGIEPREKIVWCIVPEWPAAHQGGDFLFNALHQSLAASNYPKPTVIALGAAFRNAADAYGSELHVRASSLVAQKLCEPFIDAVGFAARWDRACALGTQVPDYEYTPGRFIPAAGKTFAELPNPFEPLIELLLRGYWLSGATADALVLVSTELAKR